MGRWSRFRRNDAAVALTIATMISGSATARTSAAFLIAVALSTWSAIGFDLASEVAKANAAGGGEVVVPPGVHILPTGLKLHDVKGITIVGFDRDQCVLQLPPAVHGKVALPAAGGEQVLVLDAAKGISPGMTLRIEADGDMDPFTGKPKPYVLAKVSKTTGTRVSLEGILKHPIPAGAIVRDENAPNLIEITGKSENIHLRKLSLDGGMAPDGPELRGHAQLCGVMVQGKYSYENGPTEQGPKGVKVTDCIIRNCYGRGIAFYSATDCVVETCTIMDTQDEAIDLDHFVRGTIIKDNHIARCRVGVEVNDASACAIAFNEIRNCGTGLHVWRWCKQPGLNEKNQMIGNSLTKIAGHGIQLGTGSTDNLVAENDIDGCGKSGITIYGRNQKVVKNRITQTNFKAIAIGEAEETHTIEP
ncbi:MAG: right-handed parallel beta-helix repeat-containing protein [Verrucomicrobiaceae bacterium]|nr:right-handed parallel beta-helix repeat-containing protein [Verrucomicrobiaceae bacterium]